MADSDAARARSRGSESAPPEGLSPELVAYLDGKFKERTRLDERQMLDFFHSNAKQILDAGIKEAIVRLRSEVTPAPTQPVVNPTPAETNVRPRPSGYIPPHERRPFVPQDARQSEAPGERLPTWRSSNVGRETLPHLNLSPADNELGSAFSYQESCRQRIEELGKLDPERPRAFIHRINVATSSYGETAILHALHATLVKSDKTEVTDWYDAVMGSIDVDEADARNSVAGWVHLIQSKFCRDAFESLAYLDKLKFSWNEPINSFVSKVRAAALECNLRDPVAVCHEVVKRLPVEYLLRLDSEYSDITKLERDLRRHSSAAVAMRKNKVELDQLQDKVVRRQPFGNLSTNTPKATTGAKKTPSTPCYKCGHLHFHSGVNATPCPVPHKTTSNHVQSNAEGHYNAFSAALSGTPYTPDLDYEQHSIEDDEQTHVRSPASSPTAYKSAHVDLDQEIRPYSGGFDLDSHYVNLNQDIRPQSGGFDLDLHYVEIDCRQTTTQDRATGYQGRAPSRIVTLRADGGLPTESTFKSSVADYVKVATDVKEPWFWRPLDGGSPISLVSRQFLQKCLPRLNASPKSSDNVANIRGVNGGQSVSRDGVLLTLYLVMRNNVRAELQGYFHVVDNLSSGLLIGRDISRPYGLMVDSSEDSFFVKRHKLVGDLLKPKDAPSSPVKQSGIAPDPPAALPKRKAIESREVRVMHTTVVAPNTVHEVQVRVDSFDNDMYFLGDDSGPALSNGVFADHLLAAGDTQKVLFTNAGSHPIRLTAGTRAGVVEEADAKDVWTGAAFRKSAS